MPPRPSRSKSPVRNHPEAGLRSSAGTQGKASGFTHNNATTPIPPPIELLNARRTLIENAVLAVLDEYGNKYGKDERFNFGGLRSRMLVEQVKKLGAPLGSHNQTELITMWATRMII